MVEYSKTTLIGKGNLGDWIWPYWVASSALRTPYPGLH